MSEFRVVTCAGGSYVFPYAKVEPKPESTNEVQEFVVDRKLASGAFPYVLETGDEGSVHLHQVPEYNPLRNSGHEAGDFVFMRRAEAVR